MAGHPGKESPTPTEQDDYEDDGYFIDHDEAEENDETTLNDQYRELHSQNNNDEGNLNAATDDAPIEAVMGTENDVVTAQVAAQATNNTTRQEQLEFNIEIMTEDPNAGPGLGGVFAKYPLFRFGIPSEV